MSLCCGELVSERTGFRGTFALCTFGTNTLNRHKPLNDLTKKTLNANLVAIGLNYKDKNKTATQLENFYNELSKTAKQLVNNPNLFISKPNKGSGVVLL